MPVNCGSCGVAISRSSEPSIVCKSCNKCFHPKCANLEIKELSQAKSTWSCTVCKISNVHSTLQLLESDLSAFKSNTEKSIVNISGSIKTLVDLSEIVSRNSTKIETLESENREIKREIVLLKKHCDRMESNTRMQNVVISGIPESKNENLDDLVLKIAENLGVTLKKDQILKTSRFRPRNGTTKPILVSFAHPSIKEQLLSLYNIRKSIKGDVLGFATDIIIRIGDHLTSQKQMLLQKAKKELKSTGLYSYVWTQNGNVLIRKTSNSKICKINNLDDITRYRAQQNIN